MGKIDDTLARMAGHRVYVDTNVFVYFLDRSTDFFAVAAPILQAIEAGTLIGFSGDAALAEILVKPYQSDNLGLAASIKAFFRTEDFLTILPHDAETFDLAAQLRAKQGMKFIDALHYATAIRAGCKFFVTNDIGIRASDVLEVVQLKSLIE